MRTLIAALCIQTLCPAQPRLTIDASHFDFGKVDPGAIVSHTYKLTNSGTETLKFGPIRPSCGCTTTLLGRNVLEPGESTGLQAALNTAHEAGQVRKSIQVTTNDPAKPIRMLTFEAQVLRALIVSTDSILFQDVVRSVPRKASFHLTSATGQAVRVTSVDLSEAPWLGVTTREEDQDLWVDLELVGSRIPPGVMAGEDSITLYTANPGPATTRLWVRWELRPAVSAEPQRVVWAGGAGQGQTVTLVQAGGRPFRILSARSTLPSVSVTDIQHPAAPRQTVQLHLAAGKVGTAAGKVILTLDDPDQPELDLPVSVSRP